MNMEKVQPVKPANVDPLAVEILSGLEQFPSARHMVLGGHFALKHYCDFRPTHDVDAWWSSESTEQDRAEVRAAVDSILAQICGRHRLQSHRRRFGDTESWELLRDGVKIFSLQIAARTFQLFPYLSSPWPPLRIETLAENAASKMNALVQRGAPRDFVDVRQLVVSALATPAECWGLWQRKNPDIALEDAQAEVVRHLHEIELRRPLATMNDPAERERARVTRAWVRKDFLGLPNS